VINSKIILTGYWYFSSLSRFFLSKSLWKVLDLWNIFQLCAVTKTCCS